MSNTVSWRHCVLTHRHGVSGPTSTPLGTIIRPIEISYLDSSSPFGKQFTKLADAFRDLGLDGWELAAVWFDEAAGKPIVSYYFKQAESSDA